MRNVPATQALTSVRSISGRLTFIDYRLRFANLPASEDPSLYDLYADSDYGTGVLQVAHLKTDPTTTLCWRYVPSMSGTFPAWNTMTVTAAYHIALFGTRLFVMGAAPMYYDFLGSFWSDGTTISGGASLVAPVSATVYYTLSYVAGSPFTYGNITQYTVGGGPVVFPGSIYDTAPAKVLGAVRIGTVDTVYGTEEAGGRTWFIAFDGVNWSEKKYVIPMDVVDTVSSFCLKSVSVLDGKPFVTGLLKRDSGVSMLIYLVGPDRYTLGRDMFIGIHGIDSVGGSLHLIGNSLYYIGLGCFYKAPATTLVGYDSPALTFTTGGAVDIQVSTSSNQPGAMQIDLPSTATHPAIIPGSKVKIESCVNGEYSDIGSYNIDSVIHANEIADQTLTIVGRSEVMKALDMWQSDAPYDYWSQTKVSTLPSAMSDVIRASGQWTSVGNELTTNDLNKNGFLYTSAADSHNGTIRGRFRRTAGDYNGRFGLGLNYYLETAEEAGSRLGINATDVTESQFGHNGIFCVFGKTENSGAEGVGLYLVDTSVWTKMASAPVVLAAGVNYWVMMKCFEGHFDVHYKVDGATSWTQLLSYTIQSHTSLPWKADYMGAGAVYMNNATGTTTCRQILGNAMAVDDPTIVGAAGEILLVDDEQISVTPLTPLSAPYTSPVDRYGSPYQFAEITNTQMLYVSGSPIAPFALPQTGAGSPLGVMLGFGQGFVGIGDTPGSMFVRQKLQEGLAGTADNIWFYASKEGNPTDNLVVKLTSSTGVIKATMTIPASQLPASNILSPTVFSTSLPQVAVALTDFLSFSRSGPIDPYNYACIYCNQTGPGVGAQLSADGVVWGANQAYIFLACGTLKAPDPGYIWLSAPAGSNYGFLYPSSLVKFSASGQPGEPSIGTEYPALWSTFLGELYETARFYYHAVGTNPTMYEIVNTTASGGTAFPVYRGKFSPLPPSNFSRTYTAYPTLAITARDLAGTGQMDHVDSTINVYRPAPFVFVSQLEYFSSEQDMSLEDMVANIVGKVCTYPVLPSLIYPTSVIPSAVNPSFNKSDFVMKFTIDHTLTGTIALRARGNTPTSNQVEINFSGATVSYLSAGVLQDSFTKDTNFWGDVTVGFYNNFAAVWCGGSHVYTFTLLASDWNSAPDTVIDNTNYFYIAGTETTAIKVHIAEGCQRIDNWILDEGKSGTELISELVGEKHFFYQDGYDAGLNPGLRLFRTRTEVNTASTPYQLAISEGYNETDTGLATRIRVEGSEIAEAMDEAYMIQHGNIFRLLNLNETYSMADAAYWAGVNTYEASSTFEGETLIGACDPRIEPNDLIYVQTVRGIVKAIVSTIDAQLCVTDSEAAFDMTVTGYVPEEAYLPVVLVTRQVRLGATVGLGMSDQNRWRSL